MESFQSLLSSIGPFLSIPISLFIMYFIILNLLFRRRYVPIEKKRKYYWFVVSYGLLSSILLIGIIICFYFVVNSPAPYNSAASFISAAILTYLVQLLDEFIKGVDVYTGQILDNKQLLNHIEVFNNNILEKVQELDRKIENISSDNEAVDKDTKYNSGLVFYFAGFEVKINRKRS